METDRLGPAGAMPMTCRTHKMKGNSIFTIASVTDASLSRLENGARGEAQNGAYTKTSLANDEQTAKRNLWIYVRMLFVIDSRVSRPLHFVMLPLRPCPSVPLSPRCCFGEADLVG